MYDEESIFSFMLYAENLYWQRVLRTIGGVLYLPLAPQVRRHYNRKQKASADVR